ncbi:hypothetical protein BD779DRAFT_1515260 [Infundibulicybe gibba]|nr:hypothetical protein BD779DRAFT_1515260 [Infundibulicybe gibba]
MALSSVRIALYATLFSFSAVLLGLTAERLHHTRHLPFGDPLNPGGRHFYDPIVAELVTTSSLAIMWSLWIIAVISGRIERGHSHIVEHTGIFILWVMYLVGAAIATRHWHDVSFCWNVRACRVVTALVAFAWINWGITTFIWVLSMYTQKGRPLTAPLHGQRERGGNYPEVRETSQRPVV